MILVPFFASNKQKVSTHFYACNLAVHNEDTHYILWPSWIRRRARENLH